MNNFIPTLGVDLITLFFMVLSSSRNPGRCHVRSRSWWMTVDPKQCTILVWRKIHWTVPATFCCLKFWFFSPSISSMPEKKTPWVFSHHENLLGGSSQLVSVVKNHGHCKSPRPGVASPFQMAYMILKKCGGGPNYLHLFTNRPKNPDPSYGNTRPS